MYTKHGSPVKMMEAYVTVLTKGICQSDENGSFLIKDYDVRKAYLAGSVKGKTSQSVRRNTVILVTCLVFMQQFLLIQDNLVFRETIKATLNLEINSSYKKVLFAHVGSRSCMCF